jgi:hypothetical protein
MQKPGAVNAMVSLCHSAKAIKLQTVKIAPPKMQGVVAYSAIGAPYYALKQSERANEIAKCRQNLVLGR